MSLARDFSTPPILDRVSSLWRGARVETSQLIRLALPVFVSQIVLVVMVLVDTAMAGRVSTIDLAGVGVAQGFSIAVFVVQIGFFSGLTPVLARLKGAQEGNRIPLAMYQSLWLALAWSLVNVLILTVVSPLLIARLVEDAGVQRVADEYLRLLAWGVPAHIVYLVMRNVMESLKETVFSMKVSFVGLCLKVPLNVLFVYGIGDVDGLGGSGCGAASALTYWGMAAVSTVFAVRAMRAHGIRWRRRDCTLSLPELRELFVLGMPLAMTILSETALFSVTTLMIAPHGAIFVAGHEIAYSLSTPAYLASMSIGMAVTIRVSERLGRSQLAGAAETTRIGLALAILLAVATACITLLVRSSVSEYFSGDDEVRMLASQLLIFCAIYQIPDAIQNVLGASLRGYREAGFLLKGALCAQWLIGFPVGYLLASHATIFDHPLFPHGYWIGFLLALAATAVIYGVHLLAVERHLRNEATSGALHITTVTSPFRKELQS